MDGSRFSQGCICERLVAAIYRWTRKGGDFMLGPNAIRGRGRQRRPGKRSTHLESPLQIDRSYRDKVSRKIHVLLNRIVKGLVGRRETQRLRRSNNGAFFAGIGRDEYRYYERGRSISIYAEMLTGPVNVRIHRQILKWGDNGSPLGDDKQNEVMALFVRYLASKSITWEFYGG